MRLALPLLTLGALLGTSFQRPVPQLTVLSWEKPIAPGLVYRELVDTAGHRTINALRVSLKSPAIRATTSLFGGIAYESPTTTGRGPLGKMVSDTKALAGVNGDFFSMTTGPSGDPLGITVDDGRLLSTPSKRIAFGWGPDTVAMGVASFSGTAQDDGQVIRIDGINRKCPDDEVTLNTPDAGLALAPGGCLAVDIRLTDPHWSPSAVLKGTVESVSADRESIPVAANHAVIEARGTKRDLLSVLTPGSTVTIVLKTTGFDWDQIDTVIGGGPCLVRNGTVAVDAVDEGFNSDFTDHKHPRTAIGRTADGDLWLVAVDGRQETGDGMTLAELAQLMLSFGCVDAINLDGGGSTTMNVLGVTVNRPSDGQERAIADGVLVVGPHPDGESGTLKLSLPASITVAGTARARVVGPKGDIDAIRVIWGCQGAAAIDQSGTLRALKPGKATVNASVGSQVLTGTITVTSP